MPNRRQQNRRCRINLVIQARAGLIPASDDIADERRARLNHTARVIRAIKARSGTVSRVSDERAITNILADLRYYCDCTGLKFKKLDRAAHAQYLDEEAGAA
jgi:hypothetical protein